jgi:hypothetical protein
LERFVLWAMVSFLSACSEYDFASVKDTPKPEEVEVDTAEPEPDPPREPPPLEPDGDTGVVESPPEDPLGPPRIQVTPGDVFFEAICTREEQVLLVQNLGETPLDLINLVVTGEGWTAAHAPVPTTLAPAEVFPITMGGRGGTGRLLVVSNDPVAPEIRIPLEATPDGSPSLLIESPAGGDILSPGAVTTFQARVSDDMDAAEELLVEWRAEDGTVLSSGLADAEGAARFSWSASVLGTGPQCVTVAVTDSCANTTDASVCFCQNEGYTEESIDLESWNFEGSALWDELNGWVELTAPINTQAGTAFQTSSTVSSDAVNIEFDFYVSGGSGADGISLTAIDVDRMTTFVGGTGGGIGYYGLPGWSVEVDTWYNSEHNDPTSADHVSVHIDGNVNDPLAWAALPEMEDGGWHRAIVDVVGSHMRVWIDEVLYIDQTIGGLTPFEAYVGFTAATGGATNWHLIDALEVEGFVCDE